MVLEKKDYWDPIQYEKFKDQRTRPALDLMKLLSPCSGGRIIDLGCGTGELTESLHKNLNASRSLGIDSSEKMLQKARLYSTGGLSFENANIKDYRPNQTFDIVFSNAALQWVDRHEELFPQILGWVSSKGQIAIQMPANFDHPSHFIAADVAHRLFPEKFGKESLTQVILKLEQYAELFFKHGFREQNCSLRVYGFEMQSGYDVIEWVKGTLLTGYEKKLTPDEFVGFLKAYSKELLQTIGEGPYFYGFKRILLWGQKN